MTDVEGREFVTFITHEYAENAVSHRFRDALYMWNMQDLKQNKTPKGAL